MVNTLSAPRKSPNPTINSTPICQVSDPSLGRTESGEHKPLCPGVKLSLDPSSDHRAQQKGETKLAGDKYKYGCVSNKSELIRFPSQRLISKAVGRNTDQSGLGTGDSRGKDLSLISELFFFFLFLIMFCLCARGCPATPDTENTSPPSHLSNVHAGSSSASH